MARQDAVQAGLSATLAFQHSGSSRGSRGQISQVPPLNTSARNKKFRFSAFSVEPAQGRGDRGADHAGLDEAPPISVYTVASPAGHKGSVSAPVLDGALKRWSA
ncbi:hypothetical protein PHLGIDRAFT_117293 [Phlebiopsis gigantea 11061_1 CR5-6]|uniref:Uncharacterized protein n=1 Tax=Phlebiopsis gigantea (strain 11061_1 CR5-6) TaxID=745531 RepID=A0A0C3S0J5_PHLG1|nr:hypothetical protein PHLGIDRAFT_117293 [Phlebiopsis gigantea 11061_1 CR5-6]